MKMLALLPIITLISFTLKAPQQQVKDYLSIRGPIEFNKTAYQLSWSAHPSATYYKQEYLPAKQTSATFTNMILFEAVEGNIVLADAVKAKTNELDARKRTDALTNYQLIKNPSTGEYILDFVISQSAGTAASIVEWNAYRYMDLKDKAGKNGVLLVAYSRRSYDDSTANFLVALKKERTRDVNTLSNLKIPVVKIVPAR
jgi:hypothetical protein